MGESKMSESYRKGLDEINAIDPENGSVFVEELENISPDLADFLVDFAYGKIHARNCLEPKVKHLIAIASLIAVGDAKSHLRLRMQGAIRIGCAKNEIIEVIIQSVVYVGFTRAIAALSLFREVCSGCAVSEFAQSDEKFPASLIKIKGDTKSACSPPQSKTR